MTLSPYACAVMPIYKWMRHIRSWTTQHVNEVLAAHGPHLPDAHRVALFAEAKFRKECPYSRGGGQGWRE